MTIVEFDTIERGVVLASETTPISEIYRETASVTAISNAEHAARLCADLRAIALPVVDSEQRLIGILSIDDALTGIGGNTGSQAASTLTRALALADGRPADIGRVVLREAQVGLTMGTVLGALGWCTAMPIYGLDIGNIIGLTLLSVCTIAAVVGGAMPLLAKTLRVDPAVFSTPFISTFCDATGLLIYFTIASSILGLGAPA